MAKQTKKQVSPHTWVWVDQEDKKAHIDTVSTQLPTDKTTRFEVIDGSGRRLVEYGVNIEISMQDDGRTMKVFLTKIKGGDNE